MDSALITAKLKKLQETTDRQMKLQEAAGGLTELQEAADRSRRLQGKADLRAAGKEHKFLLGPGEWQVVIVVSCVCQNNINSVNVAVLK